MRVRMLTKPEVIELVNQGTCPVRVDLIDDGFPRGIPALQAWERELKVVPWFRLGFGHWILLDPEGTYIHATSGHRWFGKPSFGEVFLDTPSRLRRAFTRFERMQELKSSSDESSRSELKQLQKELDRELAEDFLDGFTDRRTFTALVLMDRGPVPWSEIMEHFRAPMLAWDLVSENAQRPGPAVAPGIREAVIHSIGDFLTDDRPFDPQSDKKIRDLYKSVARAGEASGSNPADVTVADWMGDSPIPPLFRRKAALSLAEIVGLDWRESDPDLVDQARAWWASHRNDPDYRIVWPDESSVNNGFVATDPPDNP